MKETLKVESIQLAVKVATRQFSVKAISEEEYQKWLDKKADFEKELTNEIETCWKQHSLHPPVFDGQ